MFMAAGLIAAALGHDQIRGLGGIGRALPLTVLAFGLAGLSLIGLPPSGGYLVKTLLSAEAIGTGQWWWYLVVQVGGLLTAAYLFFVLSQALSASPQPTIPREHPRLVQQLVVLALALCALLLGLLPLSAVDLLEIGRPAAADSGAASALLADAWSLDKLWSGLWPVLIVAALVIAVRYRQQRKPVEPEGIKPTAAPPTPTPRPSPWRLRITRPFDPASGAREQWGGAIDLNEP
jgi:NADH:ubiquinone oxidoreductase subunit 5 (subunit L)/multisubunit Na+/H+ antiporter MnhA subunit